MPYQSKLNSKHYILSERALSLPKAEFVDKYVSGRKPETRDRYMRAWYEYNNVSPAQRVRVRVYRFTCDVYQLDYGKLSYQYTIVHDILVVNQKRPLQTAMNMHYLRYETGHNGNTKSFHMVKSVVRVA